MEQDEKILQMARLIEQLNQATVEYDKGTPIMSDQDWDTLYFELLKLEHETGTYFSNSPTRKINYQVVNVLNKVAHNHKMLSLAKTKELSEVKDFIQNQPFITMTKVDGLTCSLRYENGYLKSAETRGNGIVGEDVLHNALTLPSIPQRIAYTDELIIDGEIICNINDFQEFQEEYKNPRNFAAGSIRLLDAKECARRKLSFIAWDIIKGFENLDFLSDKLNYLRSFGFNVVPFVKSEEITEDLIDVIKTLSSKQGIPLDGAVFKFDNIAYGKAQGKTTHHLKNAIAYKFYDELYPTTLKGIEWSMGRTGVLTPVAIFNPVEIDGSTVERASLHNLSVMKELLDTPWVGQSIMVYKSNMIIPQISGADLTTIPEEDLILKNPIICPLCGSILQEVKDNDSIFLKCTNDDCSGKVINQINHFCGKQGLDIKGLSKATLSKLLDWGWINSIIDIFSLEKYKAEWVKKPGFGEKSVNNILDAIEASKECSLDAFICALGIPLIGKSVSKDLTKVFSTYEDFRAAINNNFDFSSIEGFAENKTVALLDFNYAEADEIYKLLSITEESHVQNQTLNNKRFVITGSTKMFKNRTELQSFIENQGGKVVSAVSKNVDYLINNDLHSTSAKNKAAQQLNIPIISETDFMKLVFDNS